MPPGLKCGSVDDEKWLTKMYKSILFKKHLGVKHPAVLCNTPEKIKAASDVIMGRKTPELEPVSDPRPLDIVTLDQHLGRGPGDGKMMYGTNLASELQQQGFQGRSHAFRLDCFADSAGPVVISISALKYTC